MAAYKCHFCQDCTGYGCIGEMPGMGGPHESRNFLHNVEAWDARAATAASTAGNVDIRLAPITGAEENIGYADEKQFYFDMVRACVAAGITLSLGDGTPDCKLQYGIQAMQQEAAGAKAAVFIKPYPQERIFERLEWAAPVAEICGVDIDSYNIVTMRNLVHLEKKTAAQLAQLQEHLHAHGIPFAMKGVFTAEDVELVKAVRPDIVLVSNHGGRVDTREGSTADFLQQHGDTLRQYCARLWVDGGIRTHAHVQAAAALGADTVLIGRPLISALCESGADGVQAVADLLRGR